MCTQRILFRKYLFYILPRVARAARVVGAVICVLMMLLAEIEQHNSVVTTVN